MIRLWMSEKDIAMMLKGLVELKGSQRKTAKVIGCSVQYLNNVILLKKKPGPVIQRFMGVKRSTVYVYVDLEEEHPKTKKVRQPR